MKYLLFISFLLVSISMLSQSTADESPKKTWKILINNHLDKQANYQLMCQLLIDNDYIIEKKDAEFSTVKSEPQQIKDWKDSYFLYLVAKDNQIVLTGRYRSATLVSTDDAKEEVYERIEKSPIKWGADYDAYLAMLHFAKQFPDCQLEFVAN